MKISLNERLLAWLFEPAQLGAVIDSYVERVCARTERIIADALERSPCAVCGCAMPYEMGRRDERLALYRELAVMLEQLDAPELDKAPLRDLVARLEKSKS